MSRRRFAAAALLAVAATIAGLLPAGLATAATSTQPGIVVAPRGGGLLRPADDLVLDVTVTNTGTTSLPAGEVDFAVDKEPVASTSTLTQSLAATTAVLLGYLIPVHASTHALSPGASQQLRVQIDRSKLNGSISAVSGARVLYARFQTGDIASLVGRSVITPIAKGFTGRIGVGVILPITAPATATGVVDTEQQATLTAPGGEWDTALQAARAAPEATIALDPAVLASIRLAGDAAPASASAFLDSLRDLPNEVVELPFGDADRNLERAAGATSTIAPTTLAGVTVAQSTATPSTTTTKTPSLATLTAWDWSKTTVAWPVPRTTTPQDVPALGSGGAAVVLGTGDLRDSKTPLTPAARIGSTRALVVDEQASTLLVQAGSGGPAGDAALARLVGLLGTDAVSGEARSILITPGRSALLGGLVGALSTLQRASFVTGTPVSQLVAAGTSTPAVGIAPHPLPATRVSAARDLIQGEAAVRALGAAATGGSALVAPERLALTGLLSASWRRDETGWQTAATAGVQRFQHLVSEVSINQASTANYFGNDGYLPVTVHNGLGVPITVVVTGTAANGRLQITGSSRVTVPANSNSRPAKLPIRSITNGKVDVSLALTTPSGQRIGTTLVRTISVRAGFETPVAVSLIAALGLLFATGVYRNVIRRRRKPRQEAPA